MKDLDRNRTLLIKEEESHFLNTTTIHIYTVLTILNMHIPYLIKQLRIDILFALLLAPSFRKR